MLDHCRWTIIGAEVHPLVREQQQHGHLSAATTVAVVASIAVVAGDHHDREKKYRSRSRLQSGSCCARPPLSQWSPINCDHHDGGLKEQRKAEQKQISEGGRVNRGTKFLGNRSDSGHLSRATTTRHLRGATTVG